jgi:hypothetical protein
VSTPTFSRFDPFAEEAARLGAERVAAGLSSTGRAETIEDMAQRLLDVTVQAALAKGIALPDRQLVYPAPIPADCEQVAVLFTGFNPTPVQDGNPTVCQPWRWIAPMSVIITRCTPAVPGKGRALKTVPVELMVAAAKIASDDAEVLAEVVNRLDEIGSDTTIVTNAPSGGMQTVELNVPLVSGGSI